MNSINLSLALPFVIGLSVVTQGTMNRRASDDLGLNWTVFLTGVIFLIASLLLLMAMKYAPQILPEIFRIDRFSMQKVKWWFLIPAFCGFFIVVGIPWSLQLNGASKTFILLIVSQIIFGLLVDYFLFESALSFQKTLGACLVMAGAILVMLNPS